MMLTTGTVTKTRPITSFYRYLLRHIFILKFFHIIYILTFNSRQVNLNIFLLKFESKPQLNLFKGIRKV